MATASVSKTASLYGRIWPTALTCCFPIISIILWSGRSGLGPTQRAAESRSAQVRGPRDLLLSRRAEMAIVVLTQIVEQGV